MKIILAFRDLEQKRLSRDREQARIAKIEKELLPPLVTDWEEFARDSIKIIQAFTDSIKGLNQNQLAQNQSREGGKSNVSSIPQTHPTYNAVPSRSIPTEKKVTNMVSDSEDHSTNTRENRRKKSISRAKPKRDYRDMEMRDREVKSPSLSTEPRNSKKQRTDQEQDAANLLLSFSQSNNSITCSKS
jgi:hypothetical protein